MIVYCQATHNQRMNETKLCVSIMKDYVDRIVIIVNESDGDRLTPGNEAWLKANGCEIYKREWDDDMPAMRNAYLEKCQHGDWIIVSDSDESFCEDFAKDIRKITEFCDRKKIDLLLINSHDITLLENGERVDNKSDFYKNLIFKYYNGVYYEGVGDIKKVHEKLTFPHLPNTYKLEDRYYYEHFKEWHDIWERAARNVFIGGGGNNVGIKNPSWLSLLSICAELGINTWPEFREYMKKGYVHSNLKEWMFNNSHEGFDWDHEEMELGRWYYEYLHPLEDEGKWNPSFELIKGTPPEVFRFIENTYLELLGRHADQGSKELYAQGILSNEFSRDRFIQTIKDSIEYKEKHKINQTKDQKITSNIKIKVPTEVKIGLNDDIIINAICNSKECKEVMRNKVRFYDKFMSYQSVSYKIETQGKGADIEPSDTFLPYVNKCLEIMSPKDFPFMLEVGAGAGDETEAFKQVGWKVTGITTGKDNLSHAKDNYDIDLLEMDMHNLLFANDFFDCAIMIHTFEHAFAPLVVVGELYRVLKDNGRIYVAVPDPVSKGSHTIWHTNLLFSEQIIEMFRYWGFELLDGGAMKTRQGWDHYEFVFRKLPNGDPKFKNWNYLQHVYRKVQETVQ